MTKLFNPNFGGRVCSGGRLLMHPPAAAFRGRGVRLARFADQSQPPLLSGARRRARAAQPVPRPRASSRPRGDRRAWRWGRRRRHWSMAAAPVESCQFVALRSPWGRLGSVLYTCNRLRRKRGRFDRWIHISTGPQPDIGLEHKRRLSLRKPPPSAADASYKRTEL